MNGYYIEEQAKKEYESPTGRLNIEVRNLSEFKELVDKAKKEADQLQNTINRLNTFELHIDFSAGEKATSET